MDWKVSFTPTDTTDISSRDLQSHVDPKIVLSIRLGKKMIGAGMPVLLEGIAFSGHMRLRIKMFNEFPHIQSVEACFLEKPMFDYILKPIGGEHLGFDINNVSEATIKSRHDLILSYAANRFLDCRPLCKIKSIPTWVL